MSFLIAIVLPFVYLIVALLVTVPAWKRAVTEGGSYSSAWIRTLVMGLPFILLGVNRGLVYWADREVDRLCALDGGVHVFETVTLGPENFGADGTVFPELQIKLARGETKHRYGPEYSVVSSYETLLPGGYMFRPRVERGVTRYVRVADGKLLAQWTTFARTGGHLPGPWTGTSHTCPASMYPPMLDRAVFIKPGSNK